MRTFLIAWIAAAISLTAAAHPGSGVVVTPDGAVYFSDVSRRTIWHVPLGGEPAPLVQNSWTHTMALASDGSLYYEREEPAQGPAPTSLWRITPDGVRTRLIPPQQDRSMFSGPDFAIDHEGNVYFAHSVRNALNEWRAQIMRRTPQGEVRPLTGLGDGPLYTDGKPDAATIRIVTAMAAGPDGSVYFADRDHVRRIETTGDRAGHVTTLASGLIDAAPKNSPHRSGPATTINRLYGIAVDASGDICVAYQAGRRVLRVSPNGEAEVVHRSESDWSPIGVAARDGAVYVLEVRDGAIERLRVLRLERNGEPRVIASVG